ncbi:thymidylate kinase [Choiromyces venosus 120613-1]|uniref:Thymidylate kinase n=1 Tax=Choiromyces venosus 120613-1 TaxID=1336337 RepID=A0A3N4K512_9PEZI|nr:thymidylate kinase [Choiromyces venosus 120613-1]
MSTSTPKKKRGALIAIEGLDRAGKSTQCQLLMERLAERNIPAHLQKFPDRATPIGKMINAYLSTSAALEDHTIHLLFSANRWELSAHILQLLNDGVTVVLDRYVYSGIVFSAAKGLSLEYCRAPDVGLPGADVVLFLDLDAEVAAQRGGFGGERYEVQEVQGRVRGLFNVVGEREGEGRWRVVDAGGSLEEVREVVWGVVEKVVEEVGGKEVGRFE